jgi:hypothetical protein
MLARPSTTSGILQLAKGGVEKVIAFSTDALLKQSCRYLRGTFMRVLLRFGLEEEHFFRCVAGK